MLRNTISGYETSGNITDIGTRLRAVGFGSQTRARGKNPCMTKVSSNRLKMYESLKNSRRQNFYMKSVRH